MRLFETNYRNMQTPEKVELIPFPAGDISDNFEFDCAAESGIFSFKFKWLNDRWNVWVTLPDGSVRQAGTVPGVISWSEFDDYGLIFVTEKQSIDYNGLFQTEMYLITWL